VPGADHTVPATISQRHPLPKLSASIKGILDGGSHLTPAGAANPSELSRSFNTGRPGKPIQYCSPRRGKGGGANSLCLHTRGVAERLWAKHTRPGSLGHSFAVLASIGIRQSSHGTWTTRRKPVHCSTTSCASANSMAGH